MKEALAILAPILCGLGSACLVVLALGVALGHALANEPFDLVFVGLLLLMPLLAVALGLLAVRLGIGRWPSLGR